MIDPRDKESNTSRCHYYSFILNLAIEIKKLFASTGTLFSKVTNAREPICVLIPFHTK